MTRLGRHRIWTIVLASGLMCPIGMRGEPPTQEAKPTGSAAALPPEFGAERGGFRLRLSAAEKVYAVGEPIVLTSELENLTETDLTISDTLANIDHRFIVRDESGGDVELTDAGLRQIRGMISSISSVISAHGKDSDSWPIDRLYHMENPGTYTIIARRGLQFKGSSEADGFIYSNALMIRVGDKPSP